MNNYDSYSILQKSLNYSSHNGIGVVIPYPPLCWKRPGQSGTKRYDTQKALKLQIIPFFSKAMGKMKPLTGPLQVRIQCWYRQAKKGNTIYKSTKPDADNIAKIYLDIMTMAHVFLDDAQVSDLHITKKFIDFLDKTTDSYVYITVEKR